MLQFVSNFHFFEVTCVSVRVLQQAALTVLHSVVVQLGTARKVHMYSYCFVIVVVFTVIRDKSHFNQPRNVEGSETIVDV